MARENPSFLGSRIVGMTVEGWPTGAGRFIAQGIGGGKPAEIP